MRGIYTFVCFEFEESVFVKTELAGGLIEPRVQAAN